MQNQWTVLSSNNTRRNGSYFVKILGKKIWPLPKLKSSVNGLWEDGSSGGSKFLIPHESSHKNRPNREQTQNPMSNIYNKATWQTLPTNAKIQKIETNHQQPQTFYQCLSEKKQKEAMRCLKDLRTETQNHQQVFWKVQRDNLWSKAETTPVWVQGPLNEHLEQSSPSELL